MSSSTPHGSPVDLDRSVFVRGDLLALDILGFIKQWRGISVLRTCRLVKTGVYELTFHSMEHADLLMDLGFSVMMGGKKAELRPANNRRKKVEIHGLPGSFNEELLRKYLRDIGSLESLVPGSYSDEYCSVYNGVWHAVLTAKTDPPPLIHMGEYTARLLFAGQRKTCWDCHSKHPLTAKCPDPKCRNCQKSGHLAASCPLPCSKCSKSHPPSKDCKMITFLAEIFAPAAPPLDKPPTGCSTAASAATGDAKPLSTSNSPLPAASKFPPAKRKGAKIESPAPASPALPSRPTLPTTDNPVSARASPSTHEFETAYDRILHIDRCVQTYTATRQELRDFRSERASLIAFLEAWGQIAVTPK